MGNSILQSGAALGAILIPQVLKLLYSESVPDSWRLPFMVVGAAGMVWVVFWWLSLRPSDLSLHTIPTGPGKAVLPDLPRSVFLRRFAVLIVLVITINMTWHFLRAWLPLFLKTQRDFTQTQINDFATGYYIFTDLGALAAGFITLRLARSGLHVHTSRRLVYLGCALLPALCLAIPYVTDKTVLVILLMLVGFGSLGVFPNYYSFSQDLTIRHQGKVTGALGFCCWVAMFAWQISIGQMVHLTGSYTPAFLVAGFAPLVGFLALLLFWGSTEEKTPVLVDAAGTALVRTDGHEQGIQTGDRDPRIVVSTRTGIQEEQRGP